MPRAREVLDRARRQGAPGEERSYRRLLPTRLNPLRRHGVTVLDTAGTTELLLRSEASIARFGDGEFSLMMGTGLRFQDPHPLLARRLHEVLHAEDDSLLVGIPQALVTDPGIVGTEIRFWGRYLLKHGRQLRGLLPREREFVDASVTRLYIPHRDPHRALAQFEALSRVWQDRDVLLVEGAHSRMGVGNDVLAAARSVSRLLCPGRHAFDAVEEITRRTLELAGDRLVILSLGPTATVLAHDLAQRGVRALDLGHLDLEYEWALRDQGRVLVPGRSVNEIAGDSDTSLPDAVREEYESQVVGRISRGS